MKPQELRIGNAFTQQGSNIIEYVTFETFELLSRKAIIIEPVPLTEKRLLNFGFIPNTCQNRYEINKFHVYCEKRFHNRGTELVYVHKLQNLFFAVNGEELETLKKS